MITRQTITKLVVLNLIVTLVFCSPISISMALDEVVVGPPGGGGGGTGPNNKCCEVLISTHNPNGTCQRSQATFLCDASSHCDGTTEQPGGVVDAGTGCKGIFVNLNCNNGKTTNTPVAVPKGTLACPGINADLCPCTFTNTGTTTATITTCLHPDNNPCPHNLPIPVQ